MHRCSFRQKIETALRLASTGDDGLLLLNVSGRGAFAGAAAVAADTDAAVVSVSVVVCVADSVCVDAGGVGACAAAAMASLAHHITGAMAGLAIRCTFRGHRAY